MGIKVRVPTPLQKITKDQPEVACEGATVKAVIDDLEKNYPGIKERICGEDGKVRRFVNIYVNTEDIRFLSGEDTELKDGDEVSIIPAIAGGALKQVTLIFPQALIKEPVIYTMAKDYGVIPNIRRARVTEDVGEVTLELEGEDSALEQAMEYARQKGVKVEPVTGDVIGS
jgi:sulfur-carrier protein